MASYPQNQQGMPFSPGMTSAYHHTWYPSPAYTNPPYNLHHLDLNTQISDLQTRIATLEIQLAQALADKNKSDQAVIQLLHLLSISPPRDQAFNTSQDVVPFHNQLTRVITENNRVLQQVSQKLSLWENTHRCETLSSDFTKASQCPLGPRSFFDTPCRPSHSSTTLGDLLDLVPSEATVPPLSYSDRTSVANEDVEDPSFPSQDLPKIDLNFYGRKFAEATYDRDLSTPSGSRRDPYFRHFSTEKGASSRLPNSGDCLQHVGAATQLHFVRNLIDSRLEMIPRQPPPWFHAVLVALIGHRVKWFQQR